MTVIVGLGWVGSHKMDPWTTLFQTTAEENAKSLAPRTVRSADVCLLADGCCLQCFDAVGWAAGRASGL